MWNIHAYFIFYVLQATSTGRQQSASLTIYSNPNSEIWPLRYFSISRDISRIMTDLTFYESEICCENMSQTPISECDSASLMKVELEIDFKEVFCFFIYVWE